MKFGIPSTAETPSFDQSMDSFGGGGNESLTDILANETSVFCEMGGFSRRQSSGRAVRMDSRFASARACQLVGIMVTKEEKEKRKGDKATEQM